MLLKWFRRKPDHEPDLLTGKDCRAIADSYPPSLEMTLLGWGITSDSFSLMGSSLYFELHPPTRA